MKLNIAQCRSAKKTAAPRGLRRSARFASSSAPSCLQQQHIADLHVGAVLRPVSTLSPRCVVYKARTDKRGEAGRRSPSEIEAFEQNQLVTHEGAVDVQLHRQELLISRQESFTSGVFHGAALSRQTSLKIEALIEPRALSRTNSCTTIGRKRVVGVDDFSQALELANADIASSLSRTLAGHEFSPRKRFASPRTPSTCLDRSPSASLTVSELEFLGQRNSSTLLSPSTPTSNLKFGLAECHKWFPAGDSLLEDLPFDLLLRIVCCLEHDDLIAASLVCHRLSKAVSIAQDYHFSYRTPHRAKEGKSAQIYVSNGELLAHQGALADTFIRPPTPNAPKHCSTRPAELRFLDEYPFGSGLFQPHSWTPENSIKSFKMGSQRVLFDEEELCKAVEQNSL